MGQARMKNMDVYVCLAVAQSWREFRFLPGRTAGQWWALPATPWALAADDSQPAKKQISELMGVKWLLKALFSFLVNSIFSVLFFEVPCE